MTDKLTDSEIVKALPNMTYGGHYCAKCKYDNGKGNDRCGLKGCKIARYALDLITRQKTENENLKVENQSLRSAANSLKMHYEGAQAKIKRLKESLNIELENFATEYDNKIKAEAYKECIKKVKNYIKAHCNPYGKPDFDYDTSIKILNFIDKLAKEMVGENND